MAVQPKDKPIVSETVPQDWTSEEEILAKDVLRVLHKHYPLYKWGVEFAETGTGAMGSIIIRLTDYPTKTVYVINQKDVDRDRMRCVVKAGGLMLEAHGLSVGKAKGDVFRGLKQTAAGLIVPDYDAMPETNPGYETVKEQFTALYKT